MIIVAAIISAIFWVTDIFVMIAMYKLKEISVIVVASVIIVVTVIVIPVICDKHLNCYDHDICGH